MPAPDYLYSIEALRVLEARGNAAAGDPRALMVRAGQAAWRTVLEYWPGARRLLVVCGPGNNGGDGRELARNASRSGCGVEVLQWGGDTGDARGGLPDADLVVDAVFGIGLSRAPEGEAAWLLQAINRHPAPVLSLDVPSGVDADTGAAPGVAVAADHTVEFIAPKAGLRTGAARGLAGRLSLERLQVDVDPDAVGPAAECLAAAALRRWLQPRERDSHKGRHGRVLCIGGDHGQGGAILLAAEAALRSGAGLVEVLTRPAHVAPLLARLPEAMARGGDAGCVEGSLEGADVVALGPGLGQAEWGRALMREALDAGRPLVLDADALNLLARDGRMPPAGSILTPHPGEAARLLGSTTGEVQAHRYRAADALARRFDAAVVLKGAGTLVAAPGRVPRLVDAGNPGMAVAGMGDLLAGVVAALLAQGLEAFDAASCGALLHACAGDLAAAGGGERGLLPRDLLPELRRLANPEPRR